MLSILSRTIASVLLFAPLIAHSADTAEERFASAFSGSEIFECWAGREKIGLGIGAGLPYGMHRPAGLTDAAIQQGLTVEIEKLPRRQKNQVQRLWGAATFSREDTQVQVRLSSGGMALFERFGPPPHWPFKDKADSQLFFTFRLDDGPTYQCKAVYQPDQ